MKIFACAKCGETDVGCDATARWNVETQVWELAGTYDACFCDACGETSLVEQDDA